MTCRELTSRTTCYDGLFGDRTCRTTTNHPPIAATACRPTFFGERCTTRIIPGKRENTTCRTNIFGDMRCRTTYERPHSYWGPTYTSYSHDPHWSFPSYSYGHTYSYNSLPCDDTSLPSFFLGLFGISCLMAIFSR